MSRLAVAAGSVAEGTATYGRPHYRVDGQITRRLARLAADDPAWSPPREATAPPVTREPSDGWAVTGRPA